MNHQNYVLYTKLHTSEYVSREASTGSFQNPTEDKFRENPMEDPF